MLASVIVSSLLGLAPPVLPTEDGPSDAPREEAPPSAEPGASEDPARGDVEPPASQEEAPEGPSESEPPVSVTASENPDPAPEVQRPAVQRPRPPSPTVAPETSPAPSEPEPEVEEPEAANAPEEEKTPERAQAKRKLGGFRIARLGIAAKLGYTHGISQKDGIFDRNKSISDSVNNGSATVSGAGDLGTTRFGGFQGGFTLDAEVVGINVWLDFHKFFRPGGMWSVLLGYDHEFGFGERYRLDVGVGVGMQKVFLGRALERLYYDKDDPMAVNIGTLGAEGRAMVDFHIQLVGPLFTGPYAMLGYHYLWSANASEVTDEKGLHYSLGWTLRVDLATPKLRGK